MKKTTPNYLQRVHEQIKQYSNTQNIHDLPQIFHYWSNKYLEPKFRLVLGTGGIHEFYANNIISTVGESSGKTKILSIGSGDCTNEISIANILLGAKIEDFIIECIELSPTLIDRANIEIKNVNYEKYFLIKETDINRWIPSEEYNVVMAHHSLHHIVELENLFSNIKNCLRGEGLFVTCDMIGRNGHMRWPEALEVINEIWENMPERYKYNHQLKRFESQYENWDCSAEGFEGIRSQDILFLLMNDFGFDRFLGFGGIIDLFIDRGFGHNLSTDDANDCHFIDYVNALNDSLIDDGHIKPTMMAAVLNKNRIRQPIVWKHWTPSFCWRDPSK